MAKYPHLMPNEVPLWERFLAIWGKNFEGFEYDVRVGKGVDPGAEYPEPWRSLAIQLTQKRIDVVGRRDGIVYIFEVKPQAGLSALGQLLAYRILYRETFNYRGRLRLAVVTDRLNPDERLVYTRHLVEIYEVGEV